MTSSNENIVTEKVSRFVNKLDTQIVDQYQRETIVWTGEKKKSVISISEKIRCEF